MVDYIAHLIASLSFPTASEYLAKTGAVSIVQFALLAAVTHVVFARSVICLGKRLCGRPLCETDRISTELVESLATLDAAMGLVLTFSGLYGDIASGDGGDRWPILLALGSSAIGYSGMAVCAIGWSLEHALRGHRPASSPSTGTVTGGDHE